MPAQSRLPVVFVPGGVTPVALSYAPLLTELGDDIDPQLKDLEVYAADQPPAGYTIQTEVDGLLQAVDAAARSTFHLVGYSGGGAVALAFAAQFPERVRSLAMFEPANVPGAWDAYEKGQWAEFQAALAGLPPDRMLAEFTSRQLRPGAEPPRPPAGPPPPWMAQRPAGLRAMMAAFESDASDRELVRRIAMPVYLAYGDLTEAFMVHRVQILAGLLPDVWIEAYPAVHHFAPPQRSQPKHYADALRSLWARAESRKPHTPLAGDQTYAA
jgi:pimeloyl-ACP methyl ester carboxylesterase